MSDGKRGMKSDVIILSIKPKRPEFPSDKKYISVKIAVQEWDKLDAYYRGQILTLQKQLKLANAEERKLRKSSSSGRSRSSKRSHSSQGSQLTELFGDENEIPSEPEDFELTQLSDEENQRPSSRKKKDRGRSTDRKRNGHKSKHKKSDSSEDKPEKQQREEKEQSEVEVSSKKKGDEEENYLSVPRDNFVIEFAIGLKKRTPVQKSDPGQINPIKVEPYQPPVAIGFNGVHIQKILYHKSDGVQNHTSPTTTAPTPEKPPDSDSNSTSGSPLPITTESKRSSFYYRDNRDNNGIDNGTTQSTSPLFNGNKSTSSFKSIADCKNPSPIKGRNDSSISNSPSSPLKRKFAHLVTDSNSVSSTTMAPSSPELQLPVPVKKLALATDNKAKDNKDDSLFVIPLPPPPAGCQSPRNKSLSITDKIIKKAKQLPPELRERERQRRIESQKRKQYALKKNGEQTMMDSIDVSIKAMEMIWNHPLLSPLRSP